MPLFRHNTMQLNAVRSSFETRSETTKTLNIAWINISYKVAKFSKCIINNSQHDQQESKMSQITVVKNVLMHETENL